MRPPEPRARHRRRTGPAAIAAAAAAALACSGLPTAPADEAGPAAGGAPRRTPPVSARSREACTPDCRLLHELPWQTVQEHHCTLCGTHVEGACEMDWPTNDVPSCDLWDEYRNCIYATTGYPFKDAAWRRRFEREPWYTADPAWTEDRLSAVARQNIELLKTMKAQRQGCMD